MKKIKNVIFLMVFLFIAMFTYSCKTIDNIEQTESEYTVTFKDTEGNIISQVTNFIGVEFRKYQIPSIPEITGREGKWVDESGQDADFTGINNDCTFYADYVLCKYLVVFYDTDGNVIPDSADFTNNQFVEYGHSAIAPKVEMEGYTLTWDKDFSYVTSSIEVHLVKKLISYNVLFVDFDGTELSSQSVFYGYNAVEPTHPTKEADVKYTYTFAGWDKDGDGVVEEEPYVITGETVFTAVYTQTLNKYRVEFVDEDGTVLQSRLVGYGNMPVIPEDPTKEADVQYTYTFVGWDKDDDGIVDEVSDVTGDTTYKAVYSTTVNEYNVKFVDFDDTVLSDQMVAYGSSAVEPTQPTRVGYTFAGWDTNYSNITGELVVKAVYTINQYLYKFVDFDGTVLKEETVDYQTQIVAPVTPTRESDVQYHYTFAGWDVEFDKMPASDLVITAVYENEVRKYVVTYKDEDLTILAEFEEEYGTIASTPENPTKTGYTFVGWIVNGVEPSVESFVITGEMEAVAEYAINTYTVVGRIPFDFGDGNISYLEKEIAHGYYGQTGINIEDAIKSISWEREGYNLVGWKLSDGTEVSLSELTNFTIPAENTYLYPQYQIKTFTVKFYDEGDVLLSEQTIEWKNAATAPENPSKEQDDEYTYLFLCWSKPFTSVTEDMDIYAVYQKTKRQYTVTFVDDLGEVIGTSTVDYGTPAIEPEIMKEKYVGYAWTWDDDFSVVTGNKTVTATFTRKVYHITVYVGDMYYTFDRYYGDEFDPLVEIPLGGGTIRLTGNLSVKSSSGELSKSYYEGKYVVEDVEHVSFDAEYIIG